MYLYLWRSDGRHWRTKDPNVARVHVCVSICKFAQVVFWMIFAFVARLVELECDAMGELEKSSCEGGVVPGDGSVRPRQVHGVSIPWGCLWAVTCMEATVVRGVCWWLGVADKDHLQDLRSAKDTMRWGLVQRWACIFHGRTVWRRWRIFGEQNTNASRRWRMRRVTCFRQEQLRVVVCQGLYRRALLR